jgi:hypothetical protein
MEDNRVEYDAFEFKLFGSGDFHPAYNGFNIGRSDLDLTRYQIPQMFSYSDDWKFPYICLILP